MFLSIVLINTYFLLSISVTAFMGRGALKNYVGYNNVVNNNVVNNNVVNNNVINNNVINSNVVKM